MDSISAEPISNNYQRQEAITNNKKNLTDDILKPNNLKKISIQNNELYQ